MTTYEKPSVVDTFETLSGGTLGTRPWAQIAHAELLRHWRKPPGRNAAERAAYARLQKLKERIEAEGGPKGGRPFIVPLYTNNTK